MVGAAGNNTYIVDNAGDVVTESPGGGGDTVRSSITHALGAEVETLILTGAAAINGAGNALANTLIGNAAANTLNGGAGADRMVGGKTIRPRIETPAEVTGDADLLSQMIANLIENAVRHTPSGTRIDVQLSRRPDGRAELVVADDGPGIPEDQRDKVFQRFYRLEQSRHTPGNGLGLSLVAATAQLHRIGITLSDNRPGLRVALLFP